MSVITKMIGKVVNELEERQKELDKLILREKSKASVKVPEITIRKFYEAGLHLEPMMLINYFIKEIIVYDDEIKIQFHNPLQISPDESHGFLFYDNIAKKNIYRLDGEIIGLKDIRIKMRI